MIMETYILQAIIITVLTVIIRLTGGSMHSPAEDVIHVCPADYHYNEWERKCNKMAQNDNKTWEDARRQCQLEGGDLMVVDKMIKLSDLARKHDPPSMSIWVGLRQIQIDGKDTFSWVNGESLQDLKYWGGDQPDNDDPSGPECVAARKREVVGVAYQWFDEICSDVLPYACETSALINLACPHAYVSNFKTGACISVIKGPKSFSAGENQCRRHSEGLVPITNPDTKDFVIDLISHSIQDTPRYWVGLRNHFDDKNHPFQWSDGSLLNNSDPMVEFTKGPNEYCGTLQFKENSYVFTDNVCNPRITLPPVCQGDMKRVYPIFECPHGFTTSAKGTENLICLKFENNHPNDIKGALSDCVEMDARLLTSSILDIDVAKFTRRNLITEGALYWGGRTSFCKTVEFSRRQFNNASCETQRRYICEHWGTIRVLVNLRELKEIVFETQSVIYGPAGLCDSPFWTVELYQWPSMTFLKFAEQNASCLDQQGGQNECCSEVTLTNPGHRLRYPIIKINVTTDNWHCICEEGESTYKPTTEETTINTQTSVRPVMVNSTTFTPTMDHSNTLKPPTHESTTHKPTLDNSTTSKTTRDESTTLELGPDNLTTFEATMDYSTPFVPTIDYATTYKPPTNGSTTVEPDTSEPIRQETFDLLRNMTTPKNGSTTTTTNSLCPCRCDSMKFDLNPTPEVLSQMISKIQSDLKVDTEKLSSRRNKKESAVDSRRESKAMGYVGIVMCLVPLCSMVAFDISRIFQAIQWK